MGTRQGVYIDGAWSDGGGADELTIRSSADGTVVGVITAAAEQQVDAAVRAAAAAFPGWSATPVAVRTAALRAIADGVESRTEELAALSSHEVGTTIAISRAIQVGLALQVLRSTADAMDALELTEDCGQFMVEREPVGVVAAITPWNFPLHQIVAKLAPAIASGCTIVVKPAELSSLSAVALFDIIDSVGLPTGVANLVCGTGPVVGEALVMHPLVDMVSFTGSTRAGTRIGELAMRDVKKVSLELGGKSATVILDDADLGRAVNVSLGSCYTNNGQMCAALTRLIVQRSQLAEVEELLAKAVAKFTPGDPFADGTRLGPLASETQRDRVIGYIESGIAEGARVLAGGPERPDGAGYFVQPTIFTDVTSGMTIAQEEIFGPVLVVIPVDSEQEALDVANDSAFGLSGAVWSADRDRAIAFARRIRTGQVAINGGAFNASAPFGGYKKSGIGRELGRHGLEEFFEFKALLV
ncbi:MAG: aldehyde dehydrogenase family protein [Candidatus Nanopelagicales bacterium]|nr:aldehyde dehydrogenase family protein [Candidatus Nanopelagicales bacterium]